MSKIELIPAIDIIEGRCVRLSQGDYAQRKVYDADVVDMAKRYEDVGIQRIHVVDLDGAKSSSPRNLKLLERIAYRTSLDVEWGGGIKSEDSLRHVFDSGARYAIVGSVAAQQPQLFARWLECFSPERMVLGADVRRGKISVNGWLEDLELSLEELVEELLPSGLSQVICTDIERDGMLQGPSVELYEGLQSKYPTVDFTVSGGISSMRDIELLSEKQLRRVIIGKAIYENRITLKEIERWLLNG